jgi:hypothetical protein
MERFIDLDWRKVGEAISKSAKLIRLSPTKAEIYIYPYGLVKVEDNCGAVNISWGYIEELELTLPPKIRVGSFQLTFSVSYNTPGETETGLALKIKTAIDDAIAEAIALKQYLDLPWGEKGKIRVIEMRPRSLNRTINERYLVQCKEEETSAWKTESWHENLKPAIEWAINLEESQRKVEECAI